jgi:MoxR-like ATPase
MPDPLSSGPTPSSPSEYPHGPSESLGDTATPNPVAPNPAASNPFAVGAERFALEVNAVGVEVDAATSSVSDESPVVAETSPSDAELLEQTLAEIPLRFEAVRTELAKAIVGQDANIEAAFYALLSRGHCLLVGVPGLAKTLLVQALARVLRLGFKRVQFTPDLMPADITGTTILRPDDDGQRRFIFVPGPVFTQLLLADEINRTPPKTQAALLEAMQERTVTASGKTFNLEEPFFVFATQNPIEQEGTYPLPEAQLDRFLFELRVDYPSLEDERRIVSGHSFHPLEQLRQVLTREEILRFRDAAARIPAAPPVIDYAVRLVRATRPDSPDAPAYVKRWLKWGASPRASQNLILAGRARAACLGRFNVACEDITALAPLVLRHRVLRTFHAEAEGQSTDAIIARIIADMPRH